MMLSESDEKWLHNNYPALIATGDTVAGTIEFKASYDSQGHRFVILGDQPNEEIGGRVLSGTFQIRIEERTDKSTSQLPALYVEGIDPIADRHFSQSDNSACLCSPFDEREFLQPELQFRSFLERLVIPFLYGQVFYSSKRRGLGRLCARGCRDPRGLFQNRRSKLRGGVYPAIGTIYELAKNTIGAATAALCQRTYHLFLR